MLSATKNHVYQNTVCLWRYLPQMSNVEVLGLEILIFPLRLSC